ncbi:hypothetical protein ACFE04_021442 [Oxalis oulophora]
MVVAACWLGRKEGSKKKSKLLDRLKLFFEDSIRNVQAGKRVGLRTVLVGTLQRVEGADYALESIYNIREAIPELWENDVMKSEVSYPSKLSAAETQPVLA